MPPAKAVWCGRSCAWHTALERPSDPDWSADAWLLAVALSFLPVSLLCYGLALCAWIVPCLSLSPTHAAPSALATRTVTALCLPLAAIVASHTALLCAHHALWCAPFLLARPRRFLLSWRLLRECHRAPSGERLGGMRTAELLRCLQGCKLRQGNLLVVSVPNMLIWVPHLKLFFVNPMVRGLATVHTNQWGGRHPLIARYVRHIVTRPSCVDARRWPFIGYHPAPLGAQTGGTHPGMQIARHGWCNLLALSTHGRPPKSVTARSCVIAVRLHGLNPFYHLAGYVELNATWAGGVEHPMWILLDPRSALCLEHMRAVNSLFAGLWCLVRERHRTLDGAACGRPPALDAQVQRLVRHGVAQ